jgi:hypothetical protein
MSNAVIAIVPCNDLDASEAFYGRLGFRRHDSDDGGYRVRVGIELDHRVERRAGPVDRGDAVEIGLRQRAGRQLAARHALL